MKSPVAMISYSWSDATAAELLHDEFALRGFDLVHDRYSFIDGSRIPAAMATGVESCDVFVSYLTPSSLYLDQPDGQPRPALVGELLPALRRRRRNLTPGKPDTPIIIALAHGLGDRNAANETIRHETGENLGSLWGIWLDQTTSHITQPEAADVADRVFKALLERDPPNAPIDLAVATRGTTPPSRRFTVDGTRLLGGQRRPGSPTNWDRFYAAIQSVEQRLGPVATDGLIRIDLVCHLTAAYAVGRLFHQASRWSPVFVTRHGDTTPATESAATDLQGGFDQHTESGDLLIDIDLIGHNVAALADELATRLPPLGGRISLTRATTTDITPTEIGQLARFAAETIRGAHATVRPQRIHLTISAPAAYAALLGHHMTALQAEVVTYELDGSSYTPTLSIHTTTP